MELPGKPGQQASGNKEAGCELKLRVNRGRWKQNLLERGWQREQESRSSQQAAGWPRARTAVTLRHRGGEPCCHENGGVCEP